MTPQTRVLYGVAALTLLAASCIWQDSPTGVGRVSSVHLPVSIALIPSPADASAAPINRIRALATRVGDNAVVAETVLEVSPTAAEWEIAFDVPVVGSSMDVMVLLHLVNATGAAETIEFSGLAGPLTLEPGATVEPADVRLVRGPPANLFATGVEIVSVPDTLGLDGTAFASAGASTTASVPPTVFWTSLDTTIVSVADSALTGRALGTARVVASAGAFTDTADILVLRMPDLEISKSASMAAAEEGDTVVFEIVVTNPSARPVPGVSVLDSLPATLSVVGATLGSGAFDLPTGTWVLDTLPAGAADTLVLETVFGGDSLVNVARILPSADYVDPDGSNDRATAAVDASPGSGSVNVEIIKSVDESQPLPQDSVSFTVSVVNRGPGPVANVVVFDTLAAAFLSPSHTVSAGTLVGDSLWSIPLLPEGDTATWVTTVTVDPGAAGGTATNQAVLQSLAETDDTPANDTASVLVRFPLSALPTVAISSPADGSTFDPGALIQLVASASDPEDGNLSAGIRWSSDLDGALGTGASVSSSTLSTGVHLITAAVADSDGGTDQDSIRVTVALISTPTTLNVPFGGTASLPISLSEPAPPGGFTLSVTSADPSVTTPASSTVLIPGGALSANATLNGLAPGQAWVRLTSAQFGADSTLVSVTAALNVLQSSLNVPETFPQPIDIRLESAGSPIAAPGGGLSVALTSADPTCVAAPSSVTIPGGLVSQTATLAAAGGATLPCSAWVRVSAASITADSVSVTVTPTPTISVSSTQVGAGLQYGSFSAFLGASQHGGVTVRIESGDPTVMLVAPDAVTAGTAFIDVFVPNGQTAASYYVQGVEGAAGVVPLTVSAPGFVTNRAATVTVVQPALEIIGLGASQTTFSPDDVFQVRLGVPNGQLTALSIEQAVRIGGSTYRATLSSSDAVAGELVTLPDSTSPVTVDIVPGSARSPSSVAAGGVAFRPLAAGATTVSATVPGVLTTTAASVNLTIGAPTISVSSTQVGGGLQYGSFSAFLGASQHGGVTVRIESGDPTVMLVAPDAVTAGTAFIDVFVPNGQTAASYYVQGVEGAAGVVPLTVSAPGFVTNRAATVTVVQPALEIIGLGASQTTFSPDDVFQVRLGVPNGQLTALSIEQAVRIGGSTYRATLSSSDAVAGELVTLPDSTSPVTVDIVPGSARSPSSVAAGGVAFRPLAAGATTVSATVPGVLTTTAASVNLTIGAPTISVSSTQVGGGLQYGSFSAFLGASQHGGVTVRIESGDPTVMLVAPDAVTAGTAFIDVFVPNGQTAASYYVQGVEGAAGVVPLTVSAPGFVTNRAATVTVVQPALEIIGLGASQTTFSPDDVFQVRLGVPNGQLTALSIEQAVRIGGATHTATVGSTVPAVGLLRTMATFGGSVGVTINPGSSRSASTLAAGGVVFDPQASGSTTVSASIPGVVTTTNGSLGVAVSAPGISVSSTTVGAGLQFGSFGAFLGASQHGGVTVRIESSNPAVLQVAPDGTTAGTAFIDVLVPDGSTVASYFVQGVEGVTGTPTLTVTADGFTDGSAPVSVVQPAFDIISLPNVHSASGSDDPFTVRVGVPTGNLTGLSTLQPVRAGGSALTVTVTSSNPAAGRLVTLGASGGSVAVAVPAGSGVTASSVGAGGVAFDPLSAGTTSVGASIPGFIATSNAVLTVTINP